MASGNLLSERDGELLYLTLNRPDKLNALSISLQEEIVRALKQAEADKEIRVIVIKGAGRAFCAGYDIEPGGNVAYRQRTILEDVERLRQVTDRWLTVWELTKPVIAQVHGYCLAGGTDLALVCDVVIAAADAAFGHPGVRGIGLPLTHMWTYLVGPMRAKMMLLTGDTIDGLEAERVGLIAKAVLPEELDEQVREVALRMAAVPYEVSALNKRAVNRVLEEMGLKAVIRAGAELDAISHFTPPVIEFWEIANRDGLKAALAWRDRKFKDLKKK